MFSSWADGTIIAKHGSLFQLFSPLVWRSFNLERYDAVISATSYLAANMVRVKKSVHIQYIQSLPKNLYKLESPFLLQKVIRTARIFVTNVRKASLDFMKQIVKLA